MVLTTSQRILSLLGLEKSQLQHSSTVCCFWMQDLYSLDLLVQFRLPDQLHIQYTPGQMMTGSSPQYVLCTGVTHDTVECQVPLRSPYFQLNALEGSLLSEDSIYCGNNRDTALSVFAMMITWIFCVS